MPDQLIVMGKGTAGFTLRIKTSVGADSIPLEGAVSISDAKRIAKDKGFNPTHWMEVGGNRPTLLP